MRVVDTEEKLTAALEDFGPVVARDAVLLDAGRGFRVRQFAEFGARVTAVPFPNLCGEATALALIAALPPGEADVVVALWSEHAVPGSAFIAAAESLLRPRLEYQIAMYHRSPGTGAGAAGGASDGETGPSGAGTPTP